ncbi:hypothetical protein RVBP21_1900 [Pseudomonas phage BRkr]|nr:hypothetical protein RVBP21_1900 [Pseudomonas phage BRkr]
MEHVENVIEQHASLTNAGASVLKYCEDLKADLLKGLDIEAEAVKVHSTFIDRAIAGTMAGIQNDFHLVPKFIVNESGESQTVEVAPNTLEIDLAASYWATVNN